MSDVGQIERLAQIRIVKLFKDKLDYDYLGSWQDRPDNSNLERDLLEASLKARGYEPAVIKKAITALEKAAAVGGGRSLYEANRDTYELLRYGAKVSPEAGENKQTVNFIDWSNPANNDFAIAEEVTVVGVDTKRPDVVLYVNGIAVGVLELKRSFVNVTEGIRQNIGNQDPKFIAPFFSTVQLLFAGNDTEGLRYGVIETPERFWMEWNEEDSTATEANRLDLHLKQMCEKERLLELIHDFMVFDGGVKKTCRHSQFFGVKAAQKRVLDGGGGIIWHTQGSGKSLTMVWLAKWIREHEDGSRVLVVTDREELDEQIERVFLGVDEKIYRTKSGADLITQLQANDKKLLCSLVHKFVGEASADSVEAYIEELKKSLPKDFAAKGKFYVFVDECHRTQSGKLHAAMKELLPEAVFIGFTGTPLLKADRDMSIQTFGTYIHTYKFNEAVADKVVLDLRYEARDIDQYMASPDKVDQWFEAKTKGMTEHAKAELKKRWGTMQKLLSSKDRAQKIVDDILLDMETKDRLMSGAGNAMLISSSIYQACKFYEMFEGTDLAGKVAIVTSYEPTAGSISKESSGEGKTEAIKQHEIYGKMLADYFDQPVDRAIRRVDEFEDAVKEKFINEPGQMKLLIVVDKLLTGFDAPSATYLYIDKQMRDHGLFQAICRVNRLDGDKEYGYIVDYKDLFKSIEGAYADYTSGALDGFKEKDVAGLLEDRAEEACQDLDDALETIRQLCAPVQAPRNTADYLAYFCATDSGDIGQLNANEPKRVELYKSVNALVRAFAAASADLDQPQREKIKAEVEHFEKLKLEVKTGAGENLDYKAYDAGMRHLLDSYIRADDSVKVTAFDEKSLVEILATDGVQATIDQMPEGIKASPEAVSETITNNTRKLIIDETPINPKYFEDMSELLDELIKLRRKQALDYQEYLAKLEELAKKATSPSESGAYPAEISTAELQALFDNLDSDADLAQQVDGAIAEACMDGWRGNKFKEKEVLAAIKGALEGAGDVDPEAILEIAKNQNAY